MYLQRGALRCLGTIARGGLRCEENFKRRSCHHRQVGAGVIYRLGVVDEAAAYLFGRIMQKIGIDRERLDDHPERLLLARI